MTVNSLRFRISCALRRRLFPNTALHPKVLASAIGAHRDSVSNWLDQITAPNAETLARLAAYFAAVGDRGFISEVFGPEVVPFTPMPPAEDVARALTDALRALRLAA